MSAPSFNDTFAAVFDARRAIETAAIRGPVPSPLWHALTAAELRHAAATEQRISEAAA